MKLENEEAEKARLFRSLSKFMKLKQVFCLTNDSTYCEGIFLLENANSYLYVHRKAQEEQERRDYDLALRLSTVCFEVCENNFIIDKNTVVSFYLSCYCPLLLLIFDYRKVETL